MAIRKMTFSVPEPLASVRLSSVTNNSWASDLAVIMSQETSASDRSLAEDVVTALHDSGIPARGPGPPLPGGTVMGGGGFRACGKLNPQHPTVDPNYPFDVNIEIQISRRL
jgi:hypothetical protein